MATEQQTHTPSNGDAHDGLPAQKECDLVMKGGITSGIVYPPLVIKLHQVGYSFRNVGGTSAGAIAAAVAAAAEYGKKEHAAGPKEPSDCGFHKLNEVRKWLSRDGNLRKLFQPSRSTAPLMNTLFAYSQLKFLRWPTLRLLAAFLLHDTLAFIGGALLGVAFWFLLVTLITSQPEAVVKVTSDWRVIVPLFFGLLGGLLVGVFHLYQILRNTLPANNFGFCTGRGRDLDKLDETVLTDWLFANINDLAGKGKGAAAEPLTFGELWGEQEGEKPARRIDLRMMTSNLSQNQPYVLPFEEGLFLFDRKELLNFFPPSVVNHMVKHARPCEGLVLPEDYYFLPEAKNLPVIFATRLSLSFPVLISMVRLYTISQKGFTNRIRCEVGKRAAEARPIIEAAGENGEQAGEFLRFFEEVSPDNWVELTKENAHRLAITDLQPNWFSDGGICSNFPIHFFDALLPTRPTFGVNLTSQLAEGTPDPNNIEQLIKEHSIVPMVNDNTFEVGSGTRVQMRGSRKEEVYLPLPNEIIPPEWIPINGLAKFLETIFRTAQNYRDNMQAMLPSYRERIVQIRLTDVEGGLNLNMDSKIIQRVVDKGDMAGEKLAKHFDMSAHQWVRFRVLMKQMKASMDKMTEVIETYPFYMKTLETRPLNPKLPYQREDNWLQQAETQLKELNKLIGQLEPKDLFSPDAPLPEPVLRMTPQI